MCSTLSSKSLVSLTRKKHMATITVAFDPEVDAEDTIVGIVRSSYDQVIEEIVGDEPEDEEQPYPDGWTEGKMRRYVANLAADGRTALKIIAGNAPEILVVEVQRKFGYTGPSYAGMMSTFGHAVNSTRGVKHRPFVNDDGVYRIDERVALLALKALRES